MRRDRTLQFERLSEVPGLLHALLYAVTRVQHNTVLLDAWADITEQDPMSGAHSEQGPAYIMLDMYAVRETEDSRPAILFYAPARPAILFFAPARCWAS